MKKSCSLPCSPSDWKKGGKCDTNGCYENLQDQVLETIEKIQSGHYNKTDIPRYDPKITGHGVTLWALSKYFINIDPALMVEAIYALRDAGRLEVIDNDAPVSMFAPDSHSGLSFRIPKPDVQ